MPKEVRSKEEFLKLASNARSCIVVKRKGKAKLKLRRARMLYTFVTTESEADDILRNTKIEATIL